MTRVFCSRTKVFEICRATIFAVFFCKNRNYCLPVVKDRPTTIVLDQEKGSGLEKKDATSTPGVFNSCFCPAGAFAQDFYAYVASTELCLTTSKWWVSRWCILSRFPLLFIKSLNQLLREVDETLDIGLVFDDEKVKMKNCCWILTRMNSCSPTKQPAPHVSTVKSSRISSGDITIIRSYVSSIKVIIVATVEPIVFWSVLFPSAQTKGTRRKLVRGSVVEKCRGK